MSRIPGFPKIFALGQPVIHKLFEGEVEITEKVDGSQFGFGIDTKRDLVMRSKGQEIFEAKHNDMFELAVASVYRMEEKLKNRFANDVYFYAEFLNKPKHNCLTYERIPKNNLALFGVSIGYTFINDHDKLKEIADYLEIDVVPLIYKGPWETEGSYERLMKIITETQSFLGNTVIEGCVIKNYGQLIEFVGKPMPCFGKIVREDFKEKLHKEWGDISGKNSLDNFIEGFRTEARWKKAFAHLLDEGKITYSPKDIGNLIVEVQRDLESEEEQFIKDNLYKIYIKDIKRKSTAGLPEWYKEDLLKKQFTN